MQTVHHILQKNPLLTSSGSHVKTDKILNFQQKKAQQKPVTSSPSPFATTDKRIDRLFLRLAAIYGHLWSNLYKSEEFLNCTKQEWREGLQTFDNVTLGKALEHCRASVNYPPTLPMFIEVCKSLKAHTHSTAIEDQCGLRKTMADLRHFQRLRSYANPKSAILLDEIIQKLENSSRVFLKQ